MAFTKSGERKGRNSRGNFGNGRLREDFHSGNLRRRPSFSRVNLMSGGNRNSDRGKPRFSGRGKNNFHKTKATCASCKKQCEIPFKPTANKSVYCDACFEKKGILNLSSISKEEFEKINEKLDKVMKALKI